ncbi:hypothetical protein [Tardisphaera saccharovorans]
MPEEETDLYKWSYRAGRTLFDCLKQQTKSPDDSIKKQIRNFLLTLRSEQNPERFKKLLIGEIASIMPDCQGKTLGTPSQLHEDSRWKVDEFYRYSAAILAGLYDAVFSSSNQGTQQGNSQEA